MKKLFLLLLFLPFLYAQPTFPTLSGVVVDEAGIISHESYEALKDKIEQFHQKNDEQIVVVTLKSLQGYEISDFGYQLGRFWGIGEKDKNNGLLLIVAPNEREVRIEVGYGLEGVFTDAKCSQIINQEMIPFFKDKNYEAGIKNGLEAIIYEITGKGVGQKPKDDAPSDFVILLFWLLVIGFIIYKKAKSRKNRGFIDTNSHESFSSNDSFGGGFRGGGGSFGGGGASGKW